MSRGGARLGAGRRAGGSPEALAGVSCCLCHRAPARGLLVCGPCYREYAPTPMAQALGCLGWTTQYAAELVGVTAATMARAARGEPLTRRSAQTIADAFGLDVEVLVRGVEPPEELRR